MLECVVSPAMRRRENDILRRAGIQMIRLQPPGFSSSYVDWQRGRWPSSPPTRWTSARSEYRYSVCPAVDGCQGVLRGREERRIACAGMFRRHPV